MTVVAAVLTALLALLSSTRAGATTFGEIVDRCSASRVEGDDRLCTGYLTAVLALLRNPDPVMNGGHQMCVPSDDIQGKVIPAITGWGTAHPDVLGNDAVVTIGDALAGRYACR